MLKLHVNEIFYSLQGEGARKGSANVFVRFAHCNLSCEYCDAKFESYAELEPQDILNECRKYNCPNILFTGGEPLLQLTKDIVRLFKNEGYYIAIETNGMIRPLEGIDWLTVSPKVEEGILESHFKDIHINELRYVRNVSQGIPRPQVKADYYFLSPEFEGENPIRKNIEHCIELVKKHPTWRLSVQEHKLLGIR